VKSLVISDGGHRFQLLLREDVDLPAVTIREEPAHMQFISWWRGQCKQRSIAYVYRVAEPQGIRIVQNLLKKHTFEELQQLAHHFFLDYGERLRSDARHFSIFASLVETLKGELRDRA
jgi:hypothetical protein